MGLRRQDLLIALALTLSPLACRQTDDSPKAAETEKKEAHTPERSVAVPPQAEPWYAGRFQGSIPLENLPPAPELERKKRKGDPDTQPKVLPAESAELSITIHDAGLAHIVLTHPFHQETRTFLRDDELRARFVPTPERLGSGTIVLHRQGDSFTGFLSLLDPERTRPWRGVVEPGALRKAE